MESIPLLYKGYRAPSPRPPAGTVQAARRHPVAAAPTSRFAAVFINLPQPQHRQGCCLPQVYSVLS